MVTILPFLLQKYIYSKIEVEKKIVLLYPRAL